MIDYGIPKDACVVDARYWKRDEPTISGHGIASVNWDYIDWWRMGGLQGKYGMEPIEDEV